MQLAYANIADHHISNTQIAVSGTRGRPKSVFRSHDGFFQVAFLSGAAQVYVRSPPKQTWRAELRFVQTESHQRSSRAVSTV
jgi:hypothetical protein